MTTTVFILAGIMIGLVLGVAGAWFYIKNASANALATARSEAKQIKENSEKEAQNKAKEIELSARQQQIKLKEQFLEGLNGKMSKLRISSARFKPYSSDPSAPPMSDQLAEDLVRVGSDIRTQEENLRQKRSEQAIMSKQFESDIERFKELKGIH